MSAASPFRVLVIDDSAYNRVTISRMLEADPRITVVGTAVNGEDGIKQVMKHRPDAITLDLEMPIMDGFAFLRWLMVSLPTPVIAVSSRASDRSVFKALELGALDFISKPGGRVSPRLEEIQRDLVAKVLQIAEVRMDNLRRRVQEEAVQPPPTPPMPEVSPKGIELVVVGCSTGGPPALQHLFQSLTLLPLPFVVAQHMPPTFTRLFADRVNKLTSYDVHEARDGEYLVPGNVYVAPGGMQSEVHRVDEGLQVRVFPAVAADLYSPSVDRLFRTASTACGSGLIGIVMTGMGDDGSDGVRVIRKRGGKTIAESSESAIIFGMPAEAIKTGAVETVLPLGEIPEAIRKMCMG